MVRHIKSGIYIEKCIVLKSEKKLNKNFNAFEIMDYFFVEKFFSYLF